MGPEKDAQGEDEEDARGEVEEDAHSEHIHSTISFPCLRSGPTPTHGPRSWVVCANLNSLWSLTKGGTSS